MGGDYLNLNFTRQEDSFYLNWGITSYPKTVLISEKDREYKGQ